MVGHEVAVVTGGKPVAGDGDDVFRVPTRIPVGGGVLGGLLRHYRAAAWRWDCTRSSPTTGTPQ